MIEYVFTKDRKWLDAWDLFVVKNPKGSHLILSDWLQSYAAYGFEYELGLVLKHGEIIGGCGVVIPKFLFFKFYIIPHGPIYNGNHEGCFDTHLSELKKQALNRGCCYLQLSLPLSTEKSVERHVYNSKRINPLNQGFVSGKLFKYVYTTYGLNWINFYGIDNAETFLKKRSAKVRRNIRMPYNKNAKATFVTDEKSIEKGYQVILENANQGGYALRSFKEFKGTILDLIAKKQAYFIICKVDNVIKAAAFFVETSGYITNIMGGVLREKPDIKLGYMLQYEIIKKSFEQGFNGYNISMGGSLGVQDFKSKFGAENIFYENPHYHLVLNGFNFNLFKFFDSHLKPYKSKISKLLSHLK
ncbi:peptidoglycan bridge formation glycyltransferase FemA/FemB family protein [Hanstruepera ponticola]|uniref:peptidoglycan bridge formation glycyltransferase FemA/FemB family protein n=1 Tax=Hanstruepera ponticola TaxID=2042995 RepID=UPI000CF0E963|nr:peptidoglycan bridge formation glycyltransferase FemA/FemB family protein [Hanstruepera ponticola]